MLFRPHLDPLYKRRARVCDVRASPAHRLRAQLAAAAVIMTLGIARDAGAGAEGPSPYRCFDAMQSSGIGIPFTGTCPAEGPYAGLACAGSFTCFHLEDTDPLPASVRRAARCCRGDRNGDPVEHRRARHRVDLRGDREGVRVHSRSFARDRQAEALPDMSVSVGQADDPTHDVVADLYGNDDLSPARTHTGGRAVGQASCSGVVRMDEQCAPSLALHQPRQVVHPGVVAAQLAAADQEKVQLPPRATTDVADCRFGRLLKARECPSSADGLHSQDHYALIDNFFNARCMVEFSKLFNMYGLFW